MAKAPRRGKRARKKSGKGPVSKKKFVMQVEVSTPKTSATAPLYACEMTVKSITSKRK